MMNTKKNLCWFLIALMLLSFFSIGGTSGCGSPHYDGEVVDTGSGTSGSNNNSTNNNNNNTNNDSTDSNNNGSGSNGTAANIDGTWEIVSGSYVVSYDQNSSLGELAGKTVTLHYVQGNVKSFQIEMKTNDEWWTEKYGSNNAGSWSGFYSMILTGDNVLSSGFFGSSIVLDFEYDNPPSENAPLMPTPFPASIYYKPVGNNVYQATEKDQDSATGMQANAGYWKNTVTLVNNSTLKWSYWTKANDKSLGQTYGQLVGALETYREITLKRVN